MDVEIDLDPMTFAVWSAGRMKRKRLVNLLLVHLPNMFPSIPVGKVKKSHSEKQLRVRLLRLIQNFPYVAPHIPGPREPFRLCRDADARCHPMFRMAATADCVAVRDIVAEYIGVRHLQPWGYIFDEAGHRVQFLTDAWKSQTKFPLKCEDEDGRVLTVNTPIDVVSVNCPHDTNVVTEPVHVLCEDARIYLQIRCDHPTHRPWNSVRLADSALRKVLPQELEYIVCINDIYIGFRHFSE